MNTHPESTPRTNPSHKDEHWWPRLIDRINNWWTTREPAGPALRDVLTIPPIPATVAILAGLAIAVSTLGLLIWWLISGFVGIVSGLANGIRDAGLDATGRGVDHVTAWSLTRTVTEPVRGYLDQHAGGLPVTAELLWLTWLTTTGLLFLLAALGSRGARIGWILTGVTTTAMVYAATTPLAARPVAAGLTVTMWAVLSVIAFNQVATGRHSTPLIFTARPTQASED